MYGDRCVELDALDPGVVRTRVREAIESHIDTDEWEALKAIEELQRETLKETMLSIAGPLDQRIEPHVLTPARQLLERQRKILRIEDHTTWYRLADTPESEWRLRLDELSPIHGQLAKQSFTTRLGQSLEIAIYKALLQTGRFEFLGAFLNLAEHDDSAPYLKEEPPTSISGLTIPGKKHLDFLLLLQHDRSGIEAKNIREWLYPHAAEIKELLLKCCAIDAIPVLISRRIPFITFRVLNSCGVIVHQTYNQRFPESDEALAEKAKDKHLLGYHDIRLGNEPDARLLKFIGENLPKVLPAARQRFDSTKDLLRAYAESEIPYRTLLKAIKL
jgi:hypothetical protein